MTDLKQVRKILQGACISTFDAHQDDDKMLHRRAIASIIKRINFPEPEHQIDEDGRALLVRWDIRELSNGLVRVTIDHDLGVSKLERLGLVLLWMAERSEARRE